MNNFCPKNHEFTPENTRRTKTGWRVCIICKKDADRKYRAANPDNNKIRSKQWRIDNPERAKELALRSYDTVRKIIEEKKNVPCMDCGDVFPFYVMDFDHRDPSKKNINVGLTRSKLKTLEEIDKCDIVCANCHRIRTWTNKTRSEIRRQSEVL